MTRFLRLTAVSWALVVAPLTAQTTRSVSITASVSVQSAVTLAATRNIDFGSVFTTQGTLFTSTTNFGQWTGTISPGASFSASFTLPSTLTKSGSSATIPITYGSLGARVESPSGPSTEFNPSTGLSSYMTPDGNFTVYLGANSSDPTRQASINVSGAQSGVYSASIVLTIAAL